MKGNETIVSFTWWCELMGINPSHINSILKYKKLDADMRAKGLL